MITVHKVMGKIATLAMLPALTLGLFAAPAMANEVIPMPMPQENGGDEGVTTDINVTNMNGALVSNNVSVSADTGDNTANGGDAGDGGDSGDSGDEAGDGGYAGDGGDGGNAKAEVEGAEGEAFAESGYGAAGGDGAKGGNTGATGDAGDGGYGGNGGNILTGDANASLGILNEVNTNDTKVTVEDDCCGEYNEFYMSADRYYEQNREEWMDIYFEDTDSEWSDGGCGRRCQPAHGSDESTVVDASAGRSGSVVDDSHWEMYSKEFVPVTTRVDVVNLNFGAVTNSGSVDADTGDNTTNGGDAGDGGDSGNSGNDAGDGGYGGDGGNGGNAKAEVEDGGRNDNKPDRCQRDRRCHDEDNTATAIANSGADGGDGANGGNTGATGDAGNSKSGGEGGVVVTGYADAQADIISVANHNITRIVK